MPSLASLGLGAAALGLALSSAAILPARAETQPAAKADGVRADGVKAGGAKADAGKVAARTIDPKAGEKAGISRPGNAKAGEAKPGEPKTVDPKKPTDARKPAADSKGATPATTPVAAPKPATAPKPAASLTTPVARPKAPVVATTPEGVPPGMSMPAASAVTPAATPSAAGTPATTGALPISTMPAGKVTGLPVPRYASLKTDRVNLREGPSKDNRTSWVFQRAGLPVEIVAEYETWRRIRDSAGTEGWVLHSLLSGRRTALVMPWAKSGADPLPLYKSSDDKADIVARLQANVITSVKGCTSGWCRVVVAQPSGGDVAGFMRQDKLWGVYPNEKVE